MYNWAQPVLLIINKYCSENDSERLNYIKLRTDRYSYRRYNSTEDCNSADIGQ